MSQAEDEGGVVSSQEEDDAPSCTPCEQFWIGLTTPSEGAPSSSNCSEVNCPPNTKVTPDKVDTGIDPLTFNLDDYCTPCPQGYFQVSFEDFIEQSLY